MNIRDFSEWGAATEAAMAPFKEEVAKGAITNLAPPVQAMKKQASKLSDCFRNETCRNRFVKHTIDVYKGE